MGIERRDGVRGMEYDDLMNDKVRVFEATGNTYQHRDILSSWGWHYSGDGDKWIEDNGSHPNEPAIRIAANLSGVFVTEREG